MVVSSRGEAEDLKSLLERKRETNKAEEEGTRPEVSASTDAFRDNSMSIRDGGGERGDRTLCHGETLRETKEIIYVLGQYLQGAVQGHIIRGVNAVSSVEVSKQKWH